MCQKKVYLEEQIKIGEEKSVIMIIVILVLLLVFFS